MSTEDARDVVDWYFAALARKDFAAMRPLLHDDVVFKGVLGTTASAKDYIRGLTRDDGEHDTRGAPGDRRRGRGRHAGLRSRPRFARGHPTYRAVAHRAERPDRRGTGLL
jgi:ketosteroid isomerase-like protein